MCIKYTVFASLLLQYSVFYTLWQLYSVFATLVLFVFYQWRSLRHFVRKVIRECHLSSLKYFIYFTSLKLISQLEIIYIFYFTQAYFITWNIFLYFTSQLKTLYIFYFIQAFFTVLNNLYILLNWSLLHSLKCYVYSTSLTVFYSSFSFIQIY